MDEIEEILEELQINGIKINTFSQINGGINSSTYKIKSKTGQYVLKIYKSHRINNINRLNNEKKFLEFLNACNFLNVPKVIKSNPKTNWLLLSWLNGEKVQEVNATLCAELLEFILNLQEFRSSPYAKNLSSASDFHSTLNGYLSSLKARLLLISHKQKNLISLDKSFYFDFNNLINKIDSEIHDLMIFKEKNNINLDTVLPNENRIISQSDIGFHNVLHINNKMNFIDFEYAGWDDPGKLFCDLLLQPDHNIPIKYIETLESFYEEHISKISYESNRLIFLLKLTRIKWALIILNPLINTNKSPYFSRDFLNTKICKSINYLENSLWRINKINKKFLKGLY